MALNKKIIRGKKPGKTSIIMAGVHGNEMCGINVFASLLPNISIETGKVIFVIGNPRAVKRNIRFIEFNLNRAFLPASKYSNKIKNSYEYKRARELKKILKQGDALLDIHSTLHPNKPFIICEENAAEIISYFPKDFERVVQGFDVLEPGATDGFMNSRRGIGICIECGQHNSLSATAIAKKTIFSFLAARGHIDSSKIKIIKKREVIKMNYLYRSKSNSFILDKNFSDFEKIKKGTLIGVDCDQDIKSSNDCVIVFAHNRDKKNEEAFLLGEVI